MTGLGALSPLALLLFLAAPACGGSSDGSGTEDLTPSGKAKDCASTFGDSLTAAFGRIDGTVVAIVRPTDQGCALPNDDHDVVQVRMNGEVYRMVVNLQSSFGDPDVRFAAFEPSGFTLRWSEGWHAPVELDYTSSFGLHSGQAPFEVVPMADLAGRVADLIPLGAEVSVFAESSGGSYGNSAHKIHRNGSRHDGAIVIDPRGEHPKVLAFHFANQTF